jgi:hypothetical protein
MHGSNEAERRMSTYDETMRILPADAATAGKAAEETTVVASAAAAGAARALAIGGIPAQGGSALPESRGADIASADPTRISMAPTGVDVVEQTIGYTFSTHYHPYVPDLMTRLVNGSVPGLEGTDTDYQTNPDGSWQMLPGQTGRPRPKLYLDTFAADYAPTSLVTTPYPVRDIDFDFDGAYAGHNWELFYHVPLAIGITLTRNQRFQDAQTWFHYLFDPTDTSNAPSPDRFWKVRPFHGADMSSIEGILANLSTGADAALRKQTIACITAWQTAPFRPHLVARYRPSAYMMKAVTAYLDNLIAWGDSLFAQDTGETVNEATQLYILAANMLGPRPQEVPRKGWQRAQTYASLRPNLSPLADALADLEADIPFADVPEPSPQANPDSGALGSIRTIGANLYFCVPRNDMLLRYWDTVADRLFKIRNSLNMQGVFRQLPLFEPPIDPALLAKAVAAGVDIGAVIAGLNQPLPLVRFSLLLAKATEICNEVKALGGNLLSAIEKGDSEALSLLRAQHETVTLQQSEAVRYGQWQQARKSRDAIEKSFETATHRLAYYQKLMNNPASAPTALDDLDASVLPNLDPRYSTSEPDIALTPLTYPAITQEPTPDNTTISLSSFETQEIDKLADAARAHDFGAAAEAVAAVLNLIPQIDVVAKPMGVGTGMMFGGIELGRTASANASVSRFVAGQATYDASTMAKTGGYVRRQLDWGFQANLIQAEINQMYRQWRAAQITEAVAWTEWQNHQLQIQRAQTIEDFLNGNTGKISTVAFYSWLQGAVRSLYSQSFQLALDVAKKAERALQHEIGDPTLSYVQTGYLSGQQTLLAGEKLHLDLKRMEMAYHDLNRREYELTTHVSLRELDPIALMQLRMTGAATITIPEDVFDLDGPGHYFRRIRSVSVSVPCVVGPYASVNLTLSLRKSSIRTSPALGAGDDPYARDSDDTTRFSDYYGSIEAIVTSTGNGDAGLFDAGAHDDRYLPFEGAGAISQWSLSLPNAVTQFDHGTIADVVLHIRYTAREGGVPLRDAAEKHLTAAIKAGETVGSVRLLSLRHDFPTEWAQFTGAAITAQAPTAALKLALGEALYPFWSTTVGTVSTMRASVFVRPAATNKPPVTVYADAAATQKLAAIDAATMDGLYFGDLPAPSLPAATGPLAYYLDDNTMQDAWILLTWGAE